MDMKSMIVLLLLFSFSEIFTQRTNYFTFMCPSKCVCYGRSVRCIKLGLVSVPRVPVQIHILDLRFNKIQNLQPDALRDCSNLKFLLLNNNEITKLKNGTFAGLIQLRHLYLYKNKLTTIESGVFGNLRLLEHLYLQSNNIKIISDGTFSNLLRLKKIDLYNNQIQNLHPNAFNNLPQLKQLRIYNNPLTCDCRLIWLLDMIKLKNLQINGFCKYPTELHGKSLDNITIDDFQCNTPEVLQNPEDVEGIFGKNAIFSCMFKKNVQTSVRWMKNDKPIEQNVDKYSILSNGSLIIKEINSEDEDDYYCLAKNAYGNTKSKSARLLIFRSDNKEQSVGPPVILQKPDSIFSTNGASYATLTCRAIGNPRPDITWSFNGVQLLSSERHEISTDGILRISPVKFEDHGTYTCSARNPYGTQKADANILIHSPPVFTAEPENIEANIGSNIKLECIAVGSPKPELTWYKNNIPIFSSSRTEILRNGKLLIIEKATHQDSGFYSCEARNLLGSREVGAIVKISELKFKPPQFKYKPYNMEAFVGNTIEMPCHVEGDPQPGIQWQKDGATMQRTGRTKISTTGNLYINSIGLEDQGRYECIAISDYGRITASGYLTVKENPSIIRISGIGDQYVRIAFLEAAEEVDKAINNTINKLFDNKGQHNSGELFHLFRYPDAPTREIAKAAEIYERTLVNIRKHITDDEMSTKVAKDFNYREILSKEHLELIAQLSGCTTHRRLTNCTNECFHKRYRTMDGMCNNLHNPTWGSSLTPFRRILKPIYEDGYGKPVGWNKTKTYFGFPKPLARLVSISVISTHDISPDHEITHMVMQWGQFLDHDLDHALPSVSSHSWDGIDCKKSCDYAAPCFPMDVPPNDPRVRKRRCIDFIRTSAVCGSDTTSIFFDDIQPREQINQLTSYIDASQVYGYSEELAKGLRDLNSDGGRLREGPQFAGWKPLLPFASNEGIDCRRNLTESDINCFAAGDIRVNEQSGLIAMHTLWMREHNRLAKELKRINPQWNGDTLYQEARKIVGSVMQHITYKHWLPFIIGETGMKMLGPYEGYNPLLRADISNVFATAALRFGHTLINPVLHRFNENFKPIKEGHLPLRFAFFAPWRVVSEGGIDPLLRGLFTIPAKLKKSTENLNSELTEQLFRSAHAVALDLAAMNIQRSRDHGLPGYVEYRKFCNISNVVKIDDLSSQISDQSVREKLQNLYGHPGNIDVFVGGVLEDPVEGGRVGPLFQCLLVEQFKRLREGDRFYYENPSVFTPQQMVQIRKYTLSHILCQNGDNISKVTKNTFILPNLQGEFIECSSLEKLDFRPWVHHNDDCEFSNLLN